MSWRRVMLPDDFRASWAKQFGEIPAPACYEKGLLRAMVGREPVVKGDERWHISVSTPTRVPNWEELVDTCHHLRPGVPFVVGIPPRSWWMSVHPHTLHAWEIQDPHLVAEWRASRAGHTPT